MKRGEEPDWSESYRTSPSHLRQREKKVGVGGNSVSCWMFNFNLKKIYIFWPLTLSTSRGRDFLPSGEAGELKRRYGLFFRVRLMPSYGALPYRRVRYDSPSTSTCLLSLSGSAPCVRTQTWVIVCHRSHRSNQLITVEYSLTCLCPAVWLLLSLPPAVLLPVPLSALTGLSLPVWAEPLLPAVLCCNVTAASLLEDCLDAASATSAALQRAASSEDISVWRP